MILHNVNFQTVTGTNNAFSTREVVVLSAIGFPIMHSSSGIKGTLLHRKCRVTDTVQL
jgi:hypothetical protein